jgi:molecular chaperone DnaK (HSP70)
MATNLSQSIQINPAGGLSREEVDRLVEEADAHAAHKTRRRTRHPTVAASKGEPKSCRPGDPANSPSTWATSRTIT